MGEEVRITDYDVTGGDDGGGRVTEWETGLPNVTDLMPLSQFLISPEMASAFSITPEPHRSMMDVDRASRDTLLSLRPQSQPQFLSKINDFKTVSDEREEEIVLEGEETVDLTHEGSPSRKLQRVDSAGGGEGGGGGAEEADSARASKRIRLVWTPQLHKRFVEVVAHLGVKSAVPKTIMQLMNVEGLTRENVASHLQKYRLYLKRMQGLSNEGQSPSDHLFASSPVPKTLRESGGASGNEIGRGRVPVPVAYPPQMVPMLGQPPPQMVPGSNGGGGDRAYHHGFEYGSHPYSMMMQPKDWSGNNIGSISHYQHQMTHNKYNK